MTIPIRHAVKRRTGVVHHSGKPIVVELVEGGKIVRMWLKGDRKKLTLTYQQMWVLASHNAALEARQAKARAREEKRRQANA